MFYEYFSEDVDLLDIIKYEQLLKEESEVINEGILNKSPQDIRKLKLDIKETIKKLNKEDLLKKEKTIISDICEKHGIKIINIQNERSHKNDSKVFKVFAIYKDYIVDILFTVSFNDETRSVIIKMPMIDVDYDKNKCNIPTNVVFEIVNYFNTSKIWRISCREDFVEIVSYNKSTIDSVYNKVENKYSRNYNIEKGSDGMSIKIYQK